MTNKPELRLAEDGGKLLCSDSDPQWQEERRKRLTASDMIVFLNHQPTWWSASWDEILRHKLEGTEPERDHAARVRMRHGRETEALNLELAGALLGMVIVPHKKMYVHERWPYIGATTDGLLPLPWESSGDPDLELSSFTEQVMRAVKRLRNCREAVIVEAKNAKEPWKRETNWRDHAPDYHFDQCQTQMHVTGLTSCLLVGRLSGRDMSVHVLDRDPEYVEVLDFANEKAKEQLGGLWE